MRDQLVRFVNAAQPGTQTAIFALGSSLHLLQDFTDDPAVLRAAILKQGVKFSPLLREASGIDPTIQAHENAIEASSNPGLESVLKGIQSQVVTAEFREQSRRDGIRVQETLKALSEIARYLAGGNMRKNLIWISGSFPITIQRDLSTTGDPFAGSASFDEEFRETANLLAENRVAVYPVDPGGVVPAPSMMSVDSTSSTDLAATRRMSGSSSFTPADNIFDQTQSQQHATMESLADATGGKATFNSNDLIGAFRQAEQNGSEYYTFTYAPPKTPEERGFRPIEVKVNGKGLHAAYRHGYYADPSAVPSSGSSAKLASFMLPLNPRSSEVLFTVEPLPAQQQAPGKTIGESAAGPHLPITYSLNLVVDASTLNFSALADGKMHASLDFATVLYDANGKVVDSRSDHAELALDRARYEGMIQGGLRFHHNIALSARGDESVRIAVHDATTDRTGTLELNSAQISGRSRPSS